MMKTEARTINKHGITFLNMHYRSDVILGLRDKIYIRYSLFDLSKVHVYSAKKVNFMRSKQSAKGTSDGKGAWNCKGYGRIQSAIQKATTNKKQISEKG